MKPMPAVVLGLLALMPLACEKGKFNEDKAGSEVYAVTVVDGSGADPAAGDGTTKVETTDKSADKKTKDADDGTDDSGDCALAAGVSKDRVHISGSEKNMTLTPDQAFSLKVTGNQNEVTIKVSATDAANKLPALCLFVSGNQNHVILDIGSSVGQIFVKARGNSALIEGLVSKGGVVEGIKIDAKGNEPKVILKGEGKYPTL